MEGVRFLRWVSGGVVGERANQGTAMGWGVGAQSVAHPNNSIYPLRVQNFWASTVKKRGGAGTPAAARRRNGAGKKFSGKISNR